MAFAIRGVIEGFYGRPWSWAERMRMIDFMGEQGYNLYIYAPKNDPIHRNRWREPYLPEELERFAALLRQCEARGITLVFGISPLEFHYSDPGDLETLWRKLVPMHDLGIRHFSVLLDDMPDKLRYEDDASHFGTLAAAQAWLNNDLLERLRALGGEVGLLFVPTEYCGEGTSAYLQELGERLAPEVEIFWTGREVCAQYLTTADARVVSATLRRQVLYWDNYPVNDGEMRFHPHIRPVRGRDADLHTACRGIVSNGSLEPEACKIALHTYARYMADPVGYEPEAAWMEALQAVCGDAADAAAVALLGDLSRRSALERGRHLGSYLLPKLNGFWAAWGGVPLSAGPDLPDLPPASGAPPAVCAAELAAAFDRMGEAAARLLGTMANPHLQAELRPWAEKMAGWAAVGRGALGVLARATVDPLDPALPALRVAVLDQLLNTRENFAWVAGDLIDQFSRRCLWAADRLKG